MKIIDPLNFTEKTGVDSQVNERLFLKKGGSLPNQETFGSTVKNRMTVTLELISSYIQDSFPAFKRKERNNYAGNLGDEIIRLWIVSQHWRLDS